MRTSLGNLVINLLFGRQVGDTKEEQASPTYRYQKRQNKLVTLGGLLVGGGCCVVVWITSKESLAAGMTVSFGLLVAVVVRGIAAASDAVFDSLFERINAQSAWLHTRLNEIESNVSRDGSLKGQERWQHYDASMGDDAHFHTAPEWYGRERP
jgi:hypothetical protein